MNKLKQLYKWCQEHDKLAHFIGGFIFGIFGMELQPAVGLFVVKECYDTVKKSPTGFDNTDVVAGFGGWCVGNYLRKLMKV